MKTVLHTFGTQHAAVEAFEKAKCEGVCSKPALRIDTPEVRQLFRRVTTIDDCRRLSGYAFAAVYGLEERPDHVGAFLQTLIRSPSAG